MMMEGGAPRRQAIARVGKGLRIFRPSQLDFGRQLSFSPYARAVESRCWPTMRRRDWLPTHGVRRTSGAWAGMWSCRITFIYSARQTHFRLSLWRSGLGFGEIGSHARGRVVVRFRFGNASIGIGSCAARSLMRKNGSTWGIIPSGMVMCVAQKIGPIKASLIHWNGTTGEDLRRARGARPSIGWHDPWRAELCDLKQVFPRSPGSSPIHRL